MDMDTELINAGSVVAGEVTIRWDVQKIKNWERKFAIGMLSLASDVANNAKNRAPYVTGALKNSIRFGTPTKVQQVRIASAAELAGLGTPDDVIEEGEIDVVAGGTSAPMNQIVLTPTGQNATAGKGLRFVNYAAKREAGPNRNPATEHYMENALNDAHTSGWEQKYFGDIVK